MSTDDTDDEKEPTPEETPLDPLSEPQGDEGSGEKTEADVSAETDVSAEDKEKEPAPQAPPPEHLRRPHDLFHPLYGLPEENPEADMSTHWSVPWSDLMMVMFVLFAVLFTYLAANRDIREAFNVSIPHFKDKPIELDPIPEPTFDITPELLFKKSKEAVRESNIENVEVELLKDKTIKLSVRGPVFFDLGKVDLGPEIQDFLDRIARVIREIDYEVHVIGHTDDVPIYSDIYPTNWELSTARAARVIRYLIEKGIEPGRFTAIGHSEYRPDVPNASFMEKAANRRVEIIITRDVYKGDQGEKR